MKYLESFKNNKLSIFDISKEVLDKMTYDEIKEKQNEISDKQYDLFMNNMENTNSYKNLSQLYDEIDFYIAYRFTEKVYNDISNFRKNNPYYKNSNLENKTDDELYQNRFVRSYLTVIDSYGKFKFLDIPLDDKQKEIIEILTTAKKYNL